RGHLDQSVLAEVEQVGDLFEHHGVVHGVRDSSGASGACEIEAEGDVEPDALGAFALGGANPDDAFELDALDAQAVAWRSEWARLVQWVTRGRGSSSVTSRGQRFACRRQVSVPASRT